MTILALRAASIIALPSLDRRAGRTFAVDMLAALGRLDELHAMPMVGRGNNYGIDVFSLQVYNDSRDIQSVFGPAICVAFSKRFSSTSQTAAIFTSPLCIRSTIVDQMVGALSRQRRLLQLSIVGWRLSSTVTANTLKVLNTAMQWRVPATALAVFKKVRRDTSRLQIVHLPSLSRSSHNT